MLIALGIIKLLLNCELAHFTEQGKKDTRKGRENTVKMTHLMLKRTQLWAGTSKGAIFFLMRNS